MSFTIEKLRAAAGTFKIPRVITLPAYRAMLHDLTIEVYASQRRFPVLGGADALIVPVGTDLRMVNGIAKLARDRGADTVQHEALRVAPLVPGDAFIGTGAKYRYKYTALAVIFDQNKRTSPELIKQAITTAVRKLSDKGVKSVVIADMTEDLLAQPNWITQEQRRQTAEVTATVMADALLACGSIARTIKIWCSEPDNAQFFVKELKRLEEREKAANAQHIR